MHREEEEEDSKESSSDDLLLSTDVFSSKFDPLKTFYADQVQVLPDSEAPVFDNISKFESFCLKSSTKAKADCNDTQQTGYEKSSTLKSLAPRETSCTQQQLQQKSASFGRKKNYSEKNVVNRMGKFVGPLSALYQYMENKIKVKIYLRGADGISGYIEAYVVAFDTHWNLALEDCVKVWTRKRARKAYILGNKLNTERQIVTEASTSSSVKKKNKRTETLERHVPQLLLRGEHIVSVIKME